MEDKTYYPTQREQLKNKWIRILRSKAKEYEHNRGEGERDVLRPDIDEVCNEIEAFFAGLGDY